ncbi:MAG: protein phosphatase 2C domain-containing protein [Muribaculaceae bacterium]
MSEIKFRIAAKTDPGCVRTNNEDNFQAAADLSQAQMAWVNNKAYSLGEKGALLVVADGMGGMNAGEVASEIAIQTVREFFAPERITPEVLKNRFSIEKFMKDVVVEADVRIKRTSTTETRGMGTTIVIAWLINGECHICWCGDSRAYVYNPQCGLIRLTKDHSYVQNLVDAGKITDEEAFDYPNNNVITRCLCDATTKAVPDCLVTPQPLCNNDFIILCSDGLCGMIRDNQMSQIIQESNGNVDTLTDQLIDAALSAGGNDNVTVAIAAIDEGGAESTADRIPAKEVAKPHVEFNARTIPPSKPVASAKTDKANNAQPDGAETQSVAPEDNKTAKSGGKKSSKLWLVILIIIALACAAAAYVFLVQNNKPADSDFDEEEIITVDDDDNEDITETPEVSADDINSPTPAPQSGRQPRTTAPQSSSFIQSTIQQNSRTQETETVEPDTQDQPEPVSEPAEPAEPEQPTRRHTLVPVPSDN